MAGRSANSWQTAQVGQLDRIFVQVGGGAFAACVGATHPARRFHAVQAEGCAPLARAWGRALDAGTVGSTDLAAPRWGELMTPWPDPHSLADGILDDETYDWLGVFDAIGASGDAPIVAAEADIVAAHRLARSCRIRRQPHRERRARRTADDRRTPWARPNASPS